jgi:hypothetical protein
VASVEVGTAYVAIIPSAKGFAKTLQKAIAEEFAGSKLDKMISDAFAGRKVTIPVGLELDDRVDTSSISRQAIRLPVEIDRTQAAAEGVAASREAQRAAPTVRLPVEVDRDRLQTALSGAFSGAATEIASGGSAISGAVSSATSSIAGMATGLLILAGAAAFTVPSIYLAGGAIGSLPGLAVGATAALGTLALGFRGIADAFKDTAKGAGASVAASARQIDAAERGIAAAERGYQSALRESQRATEDVNRARKTAIERLEDLGRAVTGAHLDEREALLRVRDAEKDLALARHGGNLDDLERAQLAYEQSIQALDLAKDSTADLSEEQQNAARAGVEGSDEVHAALERQQSATDSLAAATEGLTAAHEALAAAQEKSSGAGDVLADIVKLAPSAQKFVDQIKALKPAFEDLRLGVQEKLFAGLSGTVKSLATAWFPQLNTTLGSYATTFNGLTKDFAKSIGQKSFIDNFAVGAEASRTALAKIGVAVSGPLVDAFGRLSKAAGPFITALGSEVADLVTDFSNWIAAADKSGKLESFFEKATGFLQDAFDMGRDVGSIVGSIIKTLFDSPDTTESPWDSLKDGLDSLAAWFADPANQEQMRGWIKDIGDAVTSVKDFIAGADDFLRKVGGFKDANVDAFHTIRDAVASIGTPITGAIGFFGRLKDGAAAHLGSMVTTMQGLPGRISSAVGSLGSLLYNAGKNVIQGLIDGIRAMFGYLESTLNYVTSRIPDWKGPPESDATLLRPAGRSILRGLIGGIAAELPALRAQLGQVTDVIAGTPLRPEQGMDLGAGLRASSALPAPGELTAQWVGSPADPVARALRSHIKINYGGSAQKALGTGAG